MNKTEIIINDERCLLAYHLHMHLYKVSFYELVDLFAKISECLSPLRFYKWVINPDKANKDISVLMQPIEAPKEIAPKPVARKRAPAKPRSRKKVVNE